MDKITIIIPVYNVEKTIKEAVDSALNQTYLNLQIILVDDGSTDSSGRICDEYKEKDERIEVVHKQNGGLSDARNAGLQCAIGKYIMFLDSDDFFEPNAVKIMYKAIEEKNADFIIGNYINTDPDGKKWNKPIFSEEFTDFKLSITEYEKSFFVMNSGVWNKIFRKEFIDKIQLKFVKGLPAEDAIFTTYCFTHSDNVYYIKDIIYNYRQAWDGSTISSNCTKSYFDGINKAYQLIYENFATTNNLSFYRYFYAKNASYILCKLIDSEVINEKDKLGVFDDLKWFFDLKNRLKARLVHPQLEKIVEYIENNKYEEALKSMKKTKEYRKKLDKVERDKMTKPSKKMYKDMSYYDKEFERNKNV